MVVDPADMYASARIAILSVLLVSAHTLPVCADDKADAARLFEEGRALVKQERFVEACAKFAESYKLERAAGTALNLADCFERQNQPENAWRLFDSAARDPEAAPAKVKFAHERADALAAKLGTVIITIHDPSVAGLTVKVGDHKLEPARELRDVVEPSDVDVVVAAPGNTPFKKVVHATAGSVTSVDVPAMKAVAPPPDPAPQQPPQPPPSDSVETHRKRSRLYIAGGLGAVSVVAFAVAIGFALDAKSTYDDAFKHGCVKMDLGNFCDHVGQGYIDDAGTQADLSTGLVVGGIVLAGAAVTVFLTAPKESITVHPVATAHSVGVGATVRW